MWLKRLGNDVKDTPEYCQLQAGPKPSIYIISRKQILRTEIYRGVLELASAI